MHILMIEYRSSCRNDEMFLKTGVWKAAFYDSRKVLMHS